MIKNKTRVKNAEKKRQVKKNPKISGIQPSVKSSIRNRLWRPNNGFEALDEADRWVFFFYRPMKHADLKNNLMGIVKIVILKNANNEKNAEKKRQVPRFLLFQSSQYWLKLSGTKTINHSFNSRGRLGNTELRFSQWHPVTYQNTIWTSNMNTAQQTAASPLRFPCTSLVKNVNGPTLGWQKWKTRRKNISELQFLQGVF